ncbi:MAG: hypothetical protein ACOY94_22495 [Bacillota bacterium]
MIYPVLRRLIALFALLSLLAFAPPAPAATCRVTDFSGVCFDTLPKLWCCSAAFLGWSEITVGDSFPVTGKVDQSVEQTEALKLVFPSGRTVTLPVAADGSFREIVTFHEEGFHRLLKVTEGGEHEFGRFAVAYRAELLDLPTVESQFGRHHARSGVSLGVVEAGLTSNLRVRFTDAKGEPVRSMAIGFGQERFATDSAGIATLSYTPPGERTGYGISRLYPGLGVIAYRTVTIDGAGQVRGLPGGRVQGVRYGGTWYLPLRAFLEEAGPLRFGDLPERILWDANARTIQIEGLAIMIDTGLVMGRSDFRANLKIIDGRTYIDLPSLIRLLDQLGMAQRTGEFTFRLSLAQEP